MFRFAGKHLKDKPGRCIKVLFFSFLLCLFGFSLLYFRLAFLSPILLWTSVILFFVGFQLSVVAYFYFWQWRINDIVARNQLNRERFRAFRR